MSLLRTLLHRQVRQIAGVSRPASGQQRTAEPHQWWAWRYHQRSCRWAEIPSRLTSLGNKLVTVLQTDFDGSSGKNLHHILPNYFLSHDCSTSDIFDAATHDFPLVKQPVHSPRTDTHISFVKRTSWFGLNYCNRRLLRYPSGEVFFLSPAAIIDPYVCPVSFLIQWRFLLMLDCCCHCS